MNRYPSALILGAALLLPVLAQADPANSNAGASQPAAGPAAVPAVSNTAGKLNPVDSFPFFPMSAQITAGNQDLFTAAYHAANAKIVAFVYKLINEDDPCPDHLNDGSCKSPASQAGIVLNVDSSDDQGNAGTVIFTVSVQRNADTATKLAQFTMEANKASYAVNLTAIPITAPATVAPSNPTRPALDYTTAVPARPAQ